MQRTLFDKGPPPSPPPFDGWKKRATAAELDAAIEEFEELIHPPWNGPATYAGYDHAAGYPD